MKTKLNKLQKEIAFAQKAAADGEPSSTVEYIKMALALKPDLDTRKLLEKAREEFSIGHPPTGETFLQLALDKAAKWKKPVLPNAKKITARLEYLRGELRAERISTGELLELQSLAGHIAPGDVELLEAAGVPEHAPARSPGAIRAAEIITGGKYGNTLPRTRTSFGVKTTEGIADLIDRETHAPALLAALESMLSIDDWHDEAIAPRATIRAARAAVADARAL